MGVIYQASLRTTRMTAVETLGHHDHRKSQLLRHQPLNL